MDVCGCSGHIALIRSLRKDRISILVKSHPPFAALSNPISVRTLPILFFSPLLTLPLRPFDIFHNAGTYFFSDAVLAPSVVLRF